eukprot:235400_1
MLYDLEYLFKWLNINYWIFLYLPITTLRRHKLLQKQFLQLQIPNFMTTNTPTNNPAIRPTYLPTYLPTDAPTPSTTGCPIVIPSNVNTLYPSEMPTESPVMRIEYNVNKIIKIRDWRYANIFCKRSHCDEILYIL